MSAGAGTVLDVPDRNGEIDPRLRVFGNRIRQLRLDRNMSVEALAEAAGVGVRFIATVEAGRGSPSVVWLLDIAKGLRVHPTELFEDR
jgi:transcriptional regulator with XRE-family HTH domain